MLLIRFLRFLRGTIWFTAADGFPERFLNLCNQAGAAIWDIQWQGGAMRGKTDRRGFRLMQPCAEPSGIALRVDKRVGLPFFLHTYRRRAGLPIGLALCVAILSVLSNTVWTIEVAGNEKVPTEEILRVMSAHGVKTGAWRGRLEPREISAAAQRELPGVAWLSLNLRGSSAVVEVREILPKDEPGPDGPRDIIAAKAGQLKVIEVYAGSAAARPSQAVPAGALLAGGVVQNADGSARLVRADAYAVARTSVACQAAAARREAAEQAELRATRYSLCLLWFKIPLGPAPKGLGGATLLTDRFDWAPLGRTMPLALERRTWLAFTPRERSKNDRQLRLSAAAAFFAQEYGVLRAAQVIRQDVEVHLGEPACNVLLRGAAYENIAGVRWLDE
ncbi:MAG: sporulation protein YqfD [Oscillospiraceae bacterium]|jgi:similar to stage IV sporulation protein|nr:sporulation protein YqfD [Oscillospiraceae bacterium]